MARQSIPILNLQDYLSDDENRKNRFVRELGEALVDIGFFSLTGHGIDLNHIDKAYAVAEEFFALSSDTKAKYENKDGPKQRGHIPFEFEARKRQSYPRPQRVLANWSNIVKGQSPLRCYSCEYLAR